MLEKMMFFRQKTKKIGTCYGFPAVTCAGLSKKSDFFDSPGKNQIDVNPARMAALSSFPLRL